jgi:subtilisin family serine protease
MARLLPTFQTADRVKVNRTGETVVLNDWSNVYVVRMNSTQVRDGLLVALNSHPDVVHAEPNGYGGPTSDPNDQYFFRQWALKNNGTVEQGNGTPSADVKAVDAWDITTGSSNVKIGIVDCGIQTNHPDFTGRVTGDAGDNSYHGTVVTGIAAAQGNNSIGVAGVAWNVGIVNEDYGDCYNSNPDPNFVAAILSAANRGSQVINNSWQLSDPIGRYSETVRKAFSDVYKLNCVSIASMGNQGMQLAVYPAASGQGIVAIGATTNTDHKADYSNSGSWIDVVAPGGEDCDGCAKEIYSTLPGSSYGFPNGEGTSFAAPHVTGIAALLLSYRPTLYNDDIENIIQLSADDKGPTGFDIEYGYGRVNARKALDLLRYPYALNYYAKSGGTVYSSTGQYNMYIFGASGLTDGQYKVVRHEVRATVSFPSISNPSVWGRGVATTGWNKEEVVGGVSRNFTMGFCEPVPGTLTSSSATLRTYVYEVWNVGGTTYYGFFPTTSSGVVYAYSVLGTCPISAPQNLTADSVKVNTSPTPFRVRLKWRTHPCATSYKVYRKGWGTYEFVNIGTVSQPDTTYIDMDVPWAPSIGEENPIHYYVTALSSSLESDSSNNVSANCAFCLEPPKSHLSIEKEKPTSYALLPNYPNPFNPVTQIKYALPEGIHVALKVYDILGREVAALVNGFEEAGYKEVNFDASALPSGMYFYRLSAGKFIQMKKMILIK